MYHFIFINEACTENVTPDSEKQENTLKETTAKHEEQDEPSQNINSLTHKECHRRLENQRFITNN